MAEQAESISYEEFLTNKGGAGLIATLYRENLTFSEILDRVDCVESTLSVRLDEAFKLGLTQQTRGKKHGRRTNIYLLSPAGKRLAQELERKGVITNHEAMLTHKRLVTEGIHGVVREIYRSPASFFMFPSIDKETFIVKEEDSVVEEVEERTVKDRIEETEQVTLDSDDFGEAPSSEEDDDDLPQWQKDGMIREGGGPDVSPPEKYLLDDEDEDTDEE